MSWLGLLGNWRTLGVALLCLFFWWKISSLQGQLALEQSEHKNTQLALVDAIEKGKGWQSAYKTVRTAAEAHRQATQACLERESEARKAAQERDSILQADTPQERTETDTKLVVNDDTRKRTADRLNRPW